MNCYNKEEVVLKGYKNALPFHLWWPGFNFLLWSQVKTRLVVGAVYVRRSTSPLAGSAQERPRAWAAGSTAIETLLGGEAKINLIHIKLRQGKKAFDYKVIRALNMVFFLVLLYNWSQSFLPILEFLVHKGRYVRTEREIPNFDTCEWFQKLVPTVFKSPLQNDLTS